MNIAGMGPSVVEKLFKAELVKDVADIYGLNSQDFLQLEGFKEKSAEKLLFGHSSLKRKFCREIALWLGYSSCWRQVSKQLLEAFGSIKELASADVEAIATVDGLGEVIAKSIQRYLPRKKLRFFLKNWKPTGLIWPILDKRWQMMLSYLVRQLF